MTEKFRDDLLKIEKLRARSAELKKKAYAHRNRMFWALNVALLALILQGITGNWEILAASSVSLFLMGFGADYCIEKRLWSFSFFRDSWNCLVNGWTARLRQNSTTE
jgi:hypothetical protein